MIKNLKRDVDGIQLGIPLSYAERRLNKYDNGSTLLYTAWNGYDLFIKENGKVRIATAKEAKKYWEEVEEKFKEKSTRRENAEIIRKRKKTI